MSCQKYIVKLTANFSVGSIFFLALLVLFVGILATKPSIAQSITPELALDSTDSTVTSSGNRTNIENSGLSEEEKNFLPSFTNFELEQNQIFNFLFQPLDQNALIAPRDNIIVASVPGTSWVRLSEPGSLLSLEIQPTTPSGSQLTTWMLSKLSWAKLVTGGGGTHATELMVKPDGTVNLTGSGIRIENGDLVVNPFSNGGEI